ncbi:hypothetical protein D3C75_1185600 [compost metagenome]
MASLTAPVEPGMEKTAVLPMVPAIARLRIAAEPMSSVKLSSRKISPKPGRVLSNREETASYVVSRGEIPVPPVRSTASMPEWTELL